MAEPSNPQQQQQQNCKVEEKSGGQVYIIKPCLALNDVKSLRVEKTRHNGSTAVKVFESPKSNSKNTLSGRPVVDVELGNQRSSIVGDNG